MRRFVVVSHTARADGDWDLNDLAGACGRADVLCRAVSTALFLSHGIRADTDVILVFVADAARPRAVRIEGAAIQRLSPDERSLAGRIRQALRAGADLEDPWWEEVDAGLQVAPFTLAEVLDDLGDSLLVLLDPEGEALEGPALEGVAGDAVYALSDHQPFTAEEAALLAGRARLRLSLGPHWYHGHAVVAVVQHRLDRIEAAIAAGAQSPS